ncbi:uncharacterized protein [Diadema setosum]|uniref:uncharacterized protein n=1 Tax=Diadema setosum TaxID=31175 RepID=UPI003B3B6453
MMAHSDSASDGEGGGGPRPENVGKTCSGNGDQESSPTNRTNSGEGAGSVAGGSTCRRSRRKQSDPRRLDSEILNVVRMDEDNVDISADAMDDEDDDDADEGDVNVDTDGYREHNQIDDEVFVRSKLKSESIALDCSGRTTRESSPRSSHSPIKSIHSKVDMDNNHGQDQLDDVTCQPEDLSVGKKKRGNNRVVLAIPSVIRPRPQSLAVQRDFVNDARDLHDSGNRSEKQQPAHSFKTLSGELQSQSNLMALERDYRLKFTPDYDAEDRESSSYINDPDFLHHGQPRFAIGHNQKLALDPDCPSSSPDLHCDSKNGKTSPSTSTSSSSSTSPSSKASKKQQRSYKNLSRSRRIVANARERNRVHTISAAFEGLRRAVPSYSHNQKLSKLAILRIACSYILALAKLADLDYSSDDQQQAMSFEDCVDLCTHTLQAEGRSKRRKGAME